ncbi:nfnB [Symbiodinium sp. CCMP2456]|nr:nfnB [Symbiodinium sp. CCMP2456]
MLMLCGETTKKVRPLGPSGPVIHCIQSGAEMAKMFRDNPNKLLRFNPLDSQHLPGPLGKFMSLDDSLVQVVDGIKKSLFFELQGPDRERLKSHMITFAMRFSDQKVLDRMYKDMRKHFETFSMEGGEKSKNLFDVIQRTIVAVLLSEMFGCSLPDDVTPARLQELANKVFGALPNGPVAEDWRMLKRVVDHMTAEAVEGSMAWHLRVTYEGKPEEKEGTIRSNMLVLLLIGTQSMANGAYWLTLCLQDPDRLSRLRRGGGKLADVLVEEMRRHPPSAPILMPYKVISAFTYCGIDFLVGEIVVISPPWQHMAFPKPHEHQEDRFSEDLAAHRQRSGCPFWTGSGPVPGKEVEAAERVLSDRTCTFGIRPFGCPMKRGAVAMLLNLGAIILQDYDVKVENLDLVSGTPFEEHMELVTVNRPFELLSARFCKRVSFPIWTAFFRIPRFFWLQIGALIVRVVRPVLYGLPSIM